MTSVLTIPKAELSSEGCCQHGIRVNMKILCKPRHGWVLMMIVVITEMMVIQTNLLITLNNHFPCMLLSRQFTRSFVMHASCSTKSLLPHNLSGFHFMDHRCRHWSVSHIVCQHQSKGGVQKRRGMTTGKACLMVPRKIS